ncbi:hypothetical protein Athai_01270 [Actinocatenispora thailandica]|uniref:Uncharacterized protein n=1 Tax=Actinocatenispora thailandica TaxID=227318 RepID=A0A7R7DJ45_9ACTN|nr:hypothetical protein [Actinocatenispora thailandica]BCJ32624.1 hypothetical protein Athai_01270 [Actinocatenispora thailandica]
MTALVFIVSFAVLLAVAQLLGFTHDSRDGQDWHPPRPRHRPPRQPADNVVPLPPRRHRHRPAA